MEFKRAGRTGGTGVRLKIEQTGSGSVLRAFMDGGLVRAESAGRRLEMYVTVGEEDVARGLGVTWERERAFSGSGWHLERASRWMGECEEGHDCEDVAEGRGWPGRLIDVGGGEDGVRLVSTPKEEKRLRYATLSHCWGAAGLPDSAKTTMDTLEEREAGIAVDTLPRTFREAIEVTRRLGLDYLWIDALCIVQGSLEDWRHEGERMDAIYSNSTVTLAAESSEDSRGGLFTDNVGPDEGMSVPITITSPLSDGQTATLIFRASDSRSLKTEARHLQSRAWALQERVVSPRILHFFDVGILWECRRHYEVWHEPSANVPSYCISHIGAQFGKEFMAPRVAYVNFQKEQLLMESLHYSTLEELQRVRQMLKERDFELPRWALYRPWFRYILPEYTHRRLTFKSDKLPAISSIARALHRQTGSTYLAGLWEEDIAFGLAWHPSSEVTETKQRVYVSMPTAIPRPSWSWASYDFGCTWRIYTSDAGYWDQDIEKTFFNSHIVLRSYEMELAGTDPFGEVRGCKLHIRGKAFPGDHVMSADGQDQKSSIYLQCRDGKTRGWTRAGPVRGLSQAWMLQEPVEKMPETVCLLLCSDREYAVLVLRNVESNTFERKDIFWLSPTDIGENEGAQLRHEFEYWMENGEEEDFVLV
ncbi:HET-domain-containing protein [Trematosphaeria pertusa]|uniref:HET-domain-containing protein n=1 Tax=Trematosphaeria pertusa TaxID=390896 RepID=A0A6A6I8N4_9PLEO|nr:HET-domain-containing protein [Trematosphaeria pertusa]KAF2245890.1 HET-domain-containing protein [Trematosphaeria pertusa]